MVEKCTELFFRNDPGKIACEKNPSRFNSPALADQVSAIDRYLGLKGREGASKLWPLLVPFSGLAEASQADTLTLSRKLKLFP